MSETQKFEYNAPTYVDFVNGFDDSDSVDKFFDMSSKQDIEGEELNATVTLQSQLTVPTIEEEFCTPDKHSTPEPRQNEDPRDDVTPRHNSMNVGDVYDQENLTPNVKASCKTPNPQNGRRSRILFEALEGLCITGSLKTHKMMTRKDPRTPLLELRGRTVPRNINFTFDNSKVEKKSCRGIRFEDETDRITQQIEKLSVSATPIQEEKEADIMPLDTSNSDRMNDNAQTDENVQANNTMTPDSEPTKLNETVTVQIKTEQNDVQETENDDQKSDENNELPVFKSPPLRCIDNEMSGHNKRKSNIISSPTTSMHSRKYVNLAKSALKCHADGKAQLAKKCGPKDTTRFLTQAKTPNLQTKSRVRPSNILSHSQEEEKIIAELRANQPKALPIPKGLFNPPKLGVRRVAVPNKYNFSTNKEATKSSSENQQVFKFPKKPINFKNNCVKVIDTDANGMTVINKEVAHKGVGLVRNVTKFKPRETKPQPFSFYEREMERFRQKEEKIKKIIEEEKKLAEFKANPLPAFVRKERKTLSSSQGSLNTTTWSHSSHCSASGEPFVFRAKSPTVLHQKPFVPRKSMKPPAQVLDFMLHTEERSHQRDVFESAKKQRELEMQLHIQEQERLEREREEAAYRLARKSTVHKPLPIPKYK